MERRTTLKAQGAVVVCTTITRDFLVYQEEMIPASMFAEIGVQIAWRPDRSCPPDAIRIGFSDRANRNFQSAVIAYALPYETTHIQVVYDRLRQHPIRLQPVLLAHVLPTKSLTSCRGSLGTRRATPCWRAGQQ
jgi:hypothetical protein